MTGHRQLYDELGISPDADGHAIRSAHRRAAKKHHPDTGGNREQFERITRAAMILRDPEKRARYDATGETETPRDNELGECASIIISAFDRAMGEGNPDAADIIGRARQFLEQDKRKIESGIAECRQAIKMISNAQRRLKFKGDGPNLIATALDALKSQAAAEIQKLETGLARIARARAMLDSYEWKFDAPNVGGIMWIST